MANDDIPQTTKDFLGRGVHFPFAFTRRTGGVYKGTTVSKSGDLQHITESVMQILYTVIGSRVIRRDFGSLLQSVVFDPNDVTLDVQFDYMIRKALETWEPRIIVGPIGIDRTEWQDGRIEISLEITIIKTNRTTNMVFPYFLSPDQRKTWVTPAAG